MSGSLSHSEWLPTKSSAPNCRCKETERCSASAGILLQPTLFIRSASLTLPFRNLTLLLNSHCHSERGGIIRLRMIPKPRKLLFGCGNCSVRRKSSIAATRPAAILSRQWFHRPNERAHEFPVHLRRNLLHIHPG